HELGRDYDSAVAEGLVDRIGAEIDKRVDARLGAGPSGTRSPAQVSAPGRSSALWTGAGIGAGIAGIVAIIANNANTGSNSTAVVTAVIAVWIILAIAALSAAQLRRHRDRDPG
ncbi:MAG: hypothetical protein ACRDPO_33830, partial [Streptosporangiaceae bacterium]